MNTDPFSDQAATAYAEVAAINEGLEATRDDTIPPIKLQPLVDAWMKAEIFPGCEHARQPIPLVGILTRPGLLFCLACAPGRKREHVLGDAFLVVAQEPFERAQSPLTLNLAAVQIQSACNGRPADCNTAHDDGTAA